MIGGKIETRERREIQSKCRRRNQFFFFLFAILEGTLCKINGFFFVILHFLYCW
jgi:hypothetical protein